MSNLNETLKSGLGGDGAYGFQFVVKFTSEKTSTAGQTKINWTISTQDIYPYDGSWYNAMAEVFLNFSGYNGGTVTNIQNNRYEWVHTNFNPGLKILEGSCIVVHNSSGKGGFTVQLDGNIGGYCDSVIDRSASYSLDDYIPYSKCAAPVATVIPAKVIPSGSFTVSWDQAKAGTSNPIVKYELYYKITKKGTVPTLSSYDKKITINSTSVKGSTTITTSNATRGYKIQYAIRTIGEIEGYHSDLKTFGPTVINSLPSAPTVSVTYSNGKNVLPSTGGQVQFNITAGSDNDPLSSFSIAYSLSSTGSPQKITSPFTCNITNTSTYYFWTFDGIEYSAATTKKIIVNTKPKITQVEIKGTDLQSANKKSGSKYIIQPTITVTATNGQNEKKYDYKLYYGSSSTSLNYLDTLSSKTSNSLTINDIRDYLIPDNVALYYKIGVTCNDGIEDSIEVFSDPCHITKVPALKGVYNRSNFTNINNFSNDNKATHYSKFLGFVFEKDEGYNILRFNNANGVSQPVSLTANTNDIRGSWNDAIVSGEGKKYNLTLQVGHTNTKFAKVIDYEITKISYISLSNLTFSFSLDGPFKYFTHGAEDKFTGNFSAGLLTKDNLLNYGIYGSNISNISSNIVIRKAGSPSAIYNTTLSPTDGGTIEYSFSATNLVSAINDLNLENNGKQNLTIQLILNNDFEDGASISKDFSVDFNEAEKIEKSSGKICPNNNSNSIDKWLYLTQGMKKLEGEFEITSYNTNPKGAIYIQRSTKPNTWEKIFSFDFTKINAEDVAAPRSPVGYKLDKTTIQSIGEISTLEYTVDYKLVVTTDGGSKEFLLYSEIPVRGHRPPVLSVKNNTYSDSTLTIDYEVTSFGVKVDDGKVSLKENKVSLYLNDLEKTNYTGSTNFFKSTSKTAIFENYNFENKESNLIKLSITTILHCYLISNPTTAVTAFDNEKSTDLESTNASSIFNLLPTIAYRKNHLGINVMNPSERENAIIVIGESTGRDSIYFQSSDGKYCKIKGFCLDSGSW